MDLGFGGRGWGGGVSRSCHVFGRKKHFSMRRGIEGESPTPATLSGGRRLALPLLPSGALARLGLLRVLLSLDLLGPFALRCAGAAGWGLGGVGVVRVREEAPICS